MTGVTISGTIGNGSLTKQGAGTLTLAAQNTYTALTLVGTGTLATDLVDALAAASDLTVDSGATFDRTVFWGRSTTQSSRASWATRPSAAC